MNNKDKELEDEIKNYKDKLIEIEKNRRNYELRIHPQIKFEDIKKYADHLDKAIIPISLLQAELKGRQEARKELIEEFEKWIQELYLKEIWSKEQYIIINEFKIRLNKLKKKKE